LRKKLSGIPGVTGINILSVVSDWVNAELLASQDDLGEAIFRSVVENGLSLAELKRDTASLEDVFTQLTRK